MIDVIVKNKDSDYQLTAQLFECKGNYFLIFKYKEWKKFRKGI